MVRKFTDDELNNIISDYNDGMTPKGLSEKYDRNSGTIISKLKSLGIYKPTRHRFTKDEIEFIRKHYTNGELDVIFDKMPFLSKSSLTCLCSKYGIRAEYHSWSEHDLNIVRDFYYTKSLDEIREMIDNRHSNDAIQTKALRHFGYSKDRSWTDDEICILKTYYPIKMVGDVCSMLPNRTRDAIIKMANNMGIKNKFYIDTYWSDNDEKFLIDNWKNMSDSELAEIFGREQHAIVDKRLLLGLVRCKHYNEATYDNIKKFIRGNIGKWKSDSMKNCDYQCVLTGSKDFQIHHVYSLSMIFNEVIEECEFVLKDNFSDYTKEELDYILEKFISKQDGYPLGVCIRTDLHQLLHRMYGQYVTPDMWEKFKDKYNNGELSI